MGSRRLLYTSTAAMLTLAVTAGAVWTDTPVVAGVRLAEPEDRYAMAGGCYRVATPSGSYLGRVSGGVALVQSEAASEPFHFQATDLGRYLLYSTGRDFLGASEGVVGAALLPAAKSTPGQIAGGATLETTDKLADEAARSPAGRASGRGATVVLSKPASELADWEITQTGTNAFTMTLPATGQALVADTALRLTDDVSQATTFSFHLTSGCASFPEIEVNVDGPIAVGESSFAEVRGMLDAHVHMMAYEFLGGRVRCGRPWHPYGVEHALVDCADHGPKGETAVLEQILNGSPGTHDTSGWPSFVGWPKNFSLTHEQIYYKWLERAWRGGLRLMVNLLVDNHALCAVYPFRRNSCNEMDGVRLQAKRIHELQRYIDAQSGGLGEGWFRIVTDPFEARKTINAGKLAVVLGIEVSTPLDCNIVLDVPLCTEEQIDERLDEVFDLDVRQMELTNKFDNALTGVTGDANEVGIVVNSGNKSETGHYWRMGRCAPEAGDAHDKLQINPHDEGFPDDLTGRDAIFGAVLEASGTSGAAPVYPEGPHCNVMGLTDLGAHALRGLISRGIIFDPDHMSAKARKESLDLLEAEGYSGVVSSHSWADDTIYPRIYELGGVVTPHAGRSGGFKSSWEKRKAEADPRYYFGIGFGSDVNGFSVQGAPRGATAANPVTYPFTAIGGTTVHKNVSGTRTWDVNTDGVAHYGLYPDWVQDLRMLAGNQIVDDLARGAEAYLQMWERASGVPLEACRAAPPLQDADMAAVTTGMTPKQVLLAVGQPSSRTASGFTFCMTGSRTATVSFDGDDLVLGVVIA